VADYINNVAAGDGYTDACTLGPDFQANEAVLTIANNPALLQFAVGKLGDWRWTDEREFFSIPQSFKVGGIIGVKVRNANPGQVARVLAVLAGPGDVEFESGQPFTGILSASGAIVPGAGIQLIQQIDLTQARIFASIPQVFKSLKLIVLARSTRAAASADQIAWALNNDGGANYDYSVVQGFNGGVFHLTGFGTAAPYLGTVPAALAAAGLVSAIEIDIPDYYDAAIQKTWTLDSVCMFGAAIGSVATDAGGGVWHSLVPVTQIELRPVNAVTFAPGSIAMLYGL
jgi:hypothetical protein